MEGRHFILPIKIPNLLMNGEACHSGRLEDSNDLPRLLCRLSTGRLKPPIVLFCVLKSDSKINTQM